MIDDYIVSSIAYYDEILCLTSNYKINCIANGFS